MSRAGTARTAVTWGPGRSARVFHRERGSGGVPVVLVHGLGMSSRSMLRALRRLGRHGRVLAPDLPGYGNTRGGGRVVAAAELADALAAWLAALGLDDVVLVGHSLGAQVVCEVAARDPGRVRKLVLVGPTRDPGAPTVTGQVLRLVADAPREHPGLMAVAALDYPRAGPLRMLRVQAHTLRHPIEVPAGRVPVPTLVLRGSRDPVSSQEWCTRLAALLPDGRLAVVPRAPHGVPFSRPDGFAAAVLAFLRPGG